MIDTEAKRRSAGTHLVTQVMPPADGSVAAADRSHAAFLYRGIAASAPPASRVFLQPSFHTGPSG